MRSFEFKDGKSNKFWNIELKDKEFTVTYGRIGTAGQQQTKSFPDPTKAKAAHDKLVTEKLGKGYVETTGAVPSKPVEPSPLQKALEKALVDNPDDLAAHSAYADYLSEHGDPRGEFIQVQLALEDEQRPAKERDELKQREKELLKAHERQWLGELADPLKKLHGCKYQFGRGWLDSVTIEELPLACAKALAKAPEVRLLRRLEIADTPYEVEEETEESYADGGPALEALVEATTLGNVRIFSLGQPSDPKGVPSEGTQDMSFRFDATAIIRKMPNIEELYLGAHGVDPKKLFALKSFTKLRILQVDHIELTYPLDILANNSSLAQLTALLICPHGFGSIGANKGDESYLPLRLVKKILHSPHFPNLKHLRLRLTDMGDDGCKEIVKSGILKRLKVLELAEGRIGDEGARILAECPDLKNLERLDVRHNWITDTGVKVLKKVLKHVDGGNQCEPGDEESLFGGDME
jgi:uncharacterized protein (TIGR02996 family)